MFRYIWDRVRTILPVSLLLVASGTLCFLLMRHAGEDAASLVGVGGICIGVGLSGWIGLLAYKDVRRWRNDTYGIFAARPDFDALGFVAHVADTSLGLADGLPRTWYEYVPARLHDTADSVPLVFYLHGINCCGLYGAEQSGWIELAERDGFACVFPDATIEDRWNGWDDPRLPSDSAFILALIEHMSTVVPLDRRRIYVSGFSMGSMMTNALASGHPEVFAGAVAKQILAQKGVYVGAHISSIYGISDASMEDWDSLKAVAAKDFPVLDDEKGAEMREVILEAKADLDSVGGSIECAVFGLPVGLGAPDFGMNAEGIFSQYLFAVPAVKAVAFGAGVAFALMRGSEANDPLYVDDDGSVKAEQNCAGGINGGITNGMPVTFEVTMRPTSSIARTQFTVDMAKMENAELNLHGRHDPCIVHRAVPVIEAAAALAACELMGI